MDFTMLEQMKDNYVKLKQYTGNYNLADPSDTTTNVEVKIPEHDFEETFIFEEGAIDIRGLARVEALEEIVTAPHNYIRQRKRAAELEEILEELKKELDGGGGS